jgi:hypothetical protein
MDFSVFKFDDPIQHLQGEERKLLKHLAMDPDYDYDDYIPDEEVKKKPRGRPPQVMAKKTAATLKPVTHAKPQAQVANSSLALTLGNLLPLINIFN